MKLRITALSLIVIFVFIYFFALTQKTKVHTPPIVITPQEFKKMLTDKNVIQDGYRIHVRYCAACHGPALQGRTGPNLVDAYWIHGRGSSEDILDLLKKGVSEKGMPAWETVLTPQELVAVTAFVLSVKGTQPADAKGPQGELISD